MILISKILQSKITATFFTIFTFVLFILPSNAFKNSPSISDKLVHCLLFAAIALLWLFSSKSVKWVVISCIAYGILIEICQATLPSHFHRSGDWEDAAYDALGVALAAIVFRILKKSEIFSFFKIK